jgi:ribonuclease Z
MKLVLLGTNGFSPTDEGQTACYMLPEVGIMLDAGSGVYRASPYLQTDSLDIYLTHAHADHFRGLEYLFGMIMKKRFTESQLQVSEESIQALLQRTDEFVNRVRVHAAPSALTEVQQACDGLTVQWCALEAEERLAGEGMLTYFALEHTTACVGFRLDWPGHALAYVTDTIAKPDAPYIDHIKGVDLLLHDCYLPNRLAKSAEQTGHSHTATVVQVAATAQVGRLILIHHNALGLKIDGAELEAARAIFPATEVGLDGMEIEF